MNKADLVRRIQASAPKQLTQQQCSVILEGVLAEIARSLAEGSRIELRGFGTFAVRTRRSRAGRNPKTGAAVEVPERHIPVLRFSPEVRTRVPQKPSHAERRGRP